MFAWPLNAIPTISVAGRFALRDRDFETRYRGRTHALHLHDYAGRMWLAGEQRRLAPGDVTISPAGFESSYDLAAPGSHWCVHFSAEAQGQTVSAPLQVTRTGSHIREQIAHISALHSRGDAVAAAMAGLALQTLLLALATSGAPRQSAAERAYAMIDERFAEALTAASIARSVGRSQAHLARMFRARYGCSIPHRLVARRVEHARYLLESTDLPIWRVAERVGIADPQHFNKSVRRLLGASPSAIRAAGAAAAIDPDR